MQGLLDYLKQGQTALTNATGMDWNKIQADPGANAQALMGGQPMQYNQQPQSLIAEQTQPVNNQSNGAFNPTPQQQGQVSYQYPEVGVNYPNFDPSAINPYLDGDQTGSVGGNANNGQNVINENFNNRITQPQVGSMLMGSPAPYEAPSEYTTQVDDTDYSQQGVISNPPPAQTTPFSFPPGILGEAFDPSMTEEEKRAREAAKANIPWYLGGTGGK